MQSAAELLPTPSTSTGKGLSDERIEAYMKRIAELDNECIGSLDKQDGYNCIFCKNRGYFLEAVKSTLGMWTHVCHECSCMTQRRNYQRNKASGIPEGCTLSSFVAKESWQQGMKDKAIEYINSRAASNGSWFYIGGAVGAGKTHLAAAIARYLASDMSVVWGNWVKDAREFKALVNSYEYDLKFKAFTNADVLVIDDLWKHSQTPTEGDLRLAYDILNERYVNRKPTIITSEWSAEEAYQIDQAIGSRIIERANGYVINIANEYGRDQRI